LVGIVEERLWAGGVVREWVWVWNALADFAEKKIKKEALADPADFTDF